MINKRKAGESLDTVDRKHRMKVVKAEKLGILID